MKVLMSRLLQQRSGQQKHTWHVQDRSIQHKEGKRKTYTGVQDRFMIQDRFLILNKAIKAHHMET